MTDRNFASSKGPRALMPFRLSAVTHAALILRAAELGTSKNAIGTEVLERWADRYIDRKAKA